MSPLKRCLKTGLLFIEFLEDRKSITNKNELREIYNLEYKGRQGIKDPKFSSVVKALVKFNKAYAREEHIYINVRPKARARPVPRAPAPVAPVLPSKKQLATDNLKKLKANRKALRSDRLGIEITTVPVSSGGKVEFLVEHLREYVVRFSILNKATHGIHFTYYTVLHKLRCLTLEDERRVTRASPLLLCPGESYDVVVRYTLSHYGCFPATVYFEFCPALPASVPFSILREVKVTARTPLAVELGPTAPYKPLQVVTQKPVDMVIEEGVPPDSSVVQRQETTVKLKDYKYSPTLKELAKRRMKDSKYLSESARKQLVSVKSLLKCSLKMENYSHRFHLLLHLEELQMEVDIRKYDMHNQTLTRDQRNSKLVTLEAPGVAENRPSVLRGDCIRVSKAEDTVAPITVYAGCVHSVELDKVKLGFSKRFLETFSSDMKLNVYFTISRFPLKLQHRAVDLATQHQLGEVLFPRGAAAANLVMPKLRMFNQQLESNPEQHAAIQRIVAGSSKPAPHLVFGPPGTGKTFTLVEAMTQVNRADASARILACAPSNSACDLLCERLMLYMDPYQVYRMYASGREPKSVPQNLLRHCNWDKGQDCFVFPEKETLMKHKVIVTTVVTAGRLVSGGIPVGHFAHVFVDEAGQALEPECIVAVAGLLKPGSGQLVLAGDPKQLGPIVRSPLALQSGLGLSLLERLMKDNPLYQKRTESGHFDMRFVTKLLRNYRSHPAILKVPNELFYENQLQVFADQWDREAYCNWEHLPKKGFPVIFHGVMGKDEREANSPSFFNVSEIEVLVDYLLKLMETQGKEGLPKLSAKDIGIIAPYRKQVEKVRKALRSVPALSKLSDLKELKVGSVEEFQGQERRIIIVTTVRSSSSYVKMDHDFNLGFLSNEKRFNVAITRARSLLIVVGNPVVLNKDPTWKKFISYCVKENAYTGFHFKDAEGEEDILSRLATLKLSVE